MTDGSAVRVSPAPDSDVRSNADPAPLPPRRGLLGVGVLAILVLGFGLPSAVTLALGAAPYTQLLQGFPGFDVALVTTVLVAGADTAMMLSVGALVYLLFLRATPSRRALRLAPTWELAVLRGAAAVWACCAAALVVFETFDANGVPLVRILEPGALPFLMRASYAPAAWAISFLAALVVFFGGYFAERWTGLLIPMWVSMLAALAPVVSGQVLVGPDHDFGGDAAVFQTVAATVLFGVLGLAWLRTASGRLLPPETLRRMFLLSAVALPVIIATDVIITVFKLAGSPLTGSLTGWLILGRGVSVTVIVGAVVVAAVIARRGALTAQRVGVALTAASVGVAGWVGTTVAMTRQPPPQYFVPTSITQVFTGFDVPDAPTMEVLFTQWRPNVLFLGIGAAAIAAYLLAVRTLHRRGDHWPVGRTTAWVLGWVAAVFATNSGFGKYSAPDFGVHMIVHMSLNMLAPGLLVLGGVITLMLRATRSRPDQPAGIHDWITWLLHWRVLQFLYNPLIVFIIFVGSYYGLYFTGLFGDFMRFHWAHQLMNLHFLIVGYLYYSLIIGVDRPPRPLPHIGKLGYALAAMPFHAFFGVILMTSPTLIAENYYRYLDLDWADLPAQQYLAGGMAWAGGEFPLLVVIVALLIQWGRQDAKEAHRKDRHLDTGRDDEFDAYNDMLRQLADRGGPRPDAPVSDAADPAATPDAATAHAPESAETGTSR